MRTQHITLQTEFKKIPELFDRNDFAIMIESIERCSLYPKDIYWRSWMKARDKCILAFLFFMGLRPKCACSLRYFDFNKKTLSFFIDGKNNKERKDRILPLPNAIVPYLLDYLKYGRFGEYIFPSFENRSKPLSTQTWKRIMREKILKPCGLWIAPTGKSRVSRTRSYSLRMSYATRLFKKYNDLSLVAQALGHSDIRSLNRYIHISSLETNQNKLRQLDL